MRAIILATGDEPGIAPFNERYPAPLLPLLDRPFLQHVIEHLAAQGVTRFDLVLSHFPEKVEHHLGDGQRWGSRFTYHLARDAHRPYRVLKAMHFDDAPGQPVLVGHADRLPALDLARAAETAAARCPVLFGWRDDGNGGSRRWTGWAVLTPDQIGGLPGDADEAALEQHLIGLAADQSWIETGRPLDTRNFPAILESHQAALDKKFSFPLLAGREVEPGVWLSRNVVLNPTAQIVPPVYLGENCQVGLGVKVGPYAVVGSDCLLDTHSTISHSVILPGSYIGEALELTEVIVDKNRLINVRVGGAMTITDDFILGSMAERTLRGGLNRVVSQLCGLLALVALSPVLLLTALCLKLFRAPVAYRKECQRLPAEEAGRKTFRLLSFAPLGEGAADVPAGFRGLLLRFVPALVNVARGELCFVGVPPRSPEEIRRLSPDWQALYLHSKPGIVTEAAVRCGPNPDEDERYAAEAYYVASAGLGYDLKLLLRYLGRALFGWAYANRVVYADRTEIPQT